MPRFFYVCNSFYFVTLSFNRPFLFILISCLVGMESFRLINYCIKYNKSARQRNNECDKETELPEKQVEQENAQKTDFDDNLIKPYNLHEEQNILSDNCIVGYDCPNSSMIKYRNGIFMEKCFAVVRMHACEENYSAKKLAEDLNIDRTAMYKKLKRYTDATPAELIEYVKIEKSLTLLSDKSLSVEDIAYECGFKSRFTFIKAFKRFNNCTPEEYRIINKLQN